MKIFDCITYFNEPLLFKLRLNILDKFVDKFIVVESLFTHSGKKKKINFDKSIYPLFKDRIEHIVLEEEPKNIIYPDQLNKRMNSVKRIQFQRDYIKKIFSKNNEYDWLIYSDSDEIPNLENINWEKNEKNIIFFKQKLFYYKFNLTLPNQDWYGSRACKLKNLESISFLRNSKPKKYDWWRLDTIYRKDKHRNVKIVENGGWHFSDLKTAKEILEKKQNDEHHDEFEKIGFDIDKIEDMVKNNYIPYDHNVDKRDFKKKWINTIKLINIDEKLLPRYLIKNKSKYQDWFD